MTGRTYRAGTFVVVAAFFLLAQFFTVVHAAEYGGKFHQHHGAPCVFQFVNENAKSLTPAASQSLLALRYAGFAARVFLQQSTGLPIVSTGNFIRGPPFFLF